MLINLNILAHNSCAQIYAQAEEEEESWSYKQNVSRAIKIWHNAASESIQRSFTPLINYDNDYYVSFRSKVSFTQFCDKFAKSEYNYPKNYNLYMHNCANAANYALKIAGIDLPVNFINLSSIVPYTFVRIPSPILTPLDVYYFARKQKTKEIQNPSNEIHANMKSNLSRLSLWAKSEKNEKKRKSVNTILSEVQKKIGIRPHQMDRYLELLIETNTLVNTANSKNKQIAHFTLANKYKDRQANRIDEAAGQCVNIILLAYSATLIKDGIEHYENNGQFISSWLTHPLLYDDWWFSLPIVLILCASYIQFVHAFLNYNIRMTLEPKANALSQAIDELALEFSSNSADDTACVNKL